VENLDALNSEQVAEKKSKVSDENVKELHE